MILAPAFPYSSVRDPLVIPGYAIRNPPPINGNVVDDQWKSIPSVSGLVNEVSNRPEPETSKFWIGYDANFIYVAARLGDNDPKSIKATQYQTNVNLDFDDFIRVSIDPSGTGRDFSQFSVNPRGATFTQLAGGRANKREWSGSFLAAARITAQGWEAEMRIPWRELTLPVSGRRDVRINFERFVPRTGQGYGLIDRAPGNTARYPVWRGVEVPQLKPDHSIQALAYSYLGYDPSAGPIVSAGVDAKASITQRIQFVGSIHPDFRDVENQILSLDYSRLPRIAGETRPFFLEGDQYFDSTLFASQTIPRFDIGAKFFGKLDDRTSFGILDLDQFGTQNDFMSSFSFAATPTTSYRLSTAQFESAAFRNQAYAGSIREAVGPWAVSASGARTTDSANGSGESESAGFLYRSAGIAAVGSYSAADASFLPRMGFVPEVDYRKYRASLLMNRPFESGRWMEMGANASLNVLDHYDGSDYRRSTTFNSYILSRNGLYLGGFASFDQFEGSHDHSYTLSASYPATNFQNQISLSQTLGEEAALKYQSTSVSLSRMLGKRMSLTSSYQLVGLGGFNDLGIVGANYDLKRDMSIYGRLVTRSGEVNGYLGFRKSGTMGTDYFLIVGDPNASRFKPSVILKLVMPFRL